MKAAIFIIACIGLSFASCKKKGCTDYYATNYLETNTKDDQSCTWGSTPQIRGEWGEDEVLDSVVVFSATGGQYDISKWWVGYEHQGSLPSNVFQFSDDVYIADRGAIYVEFSYFGFTPDETTILYLSDSSLFLIDQWMIPQ